MTSYHNRAIVQKRIEELRNWGIKSSKSNGLAQSLSAVGKGRAKSESAQRGTLFYLVYHRGGYIMNLGKAPDQGTIALILITAIITSLIVGVFGKKLAESVLELILKPLRFFYEALYRWIALGIHYQCLCGAIVSTCFARTLPGWRTPLAPISVSHSSTPLPL